MTEGTIPVISIVVLAGGQSSRLGRDKSFLMLDGQPLVARTIQTLLPLSDDLVIVTNRPQQYEPLALPVRLIPDERVGEGALMGLYSGLKASQHPYALAVACDMPFLNLPLLRHMVSLAEGYDVVVPRIGDWFEPLHAIYSKDCLRPMARLLELGKRQIIAFYQEVRVRFLEEPVLNGFDPHHLSFVNVNTEEDWQRVQALAQEQEQ